MSRDKKKRKILRGKGENRQVRKEECNEVKCKEGILEEDNMRFTAEE